MELDERLADKFAILRDGARGNDEPHSALWLALGHDQAAGFRPSSRSLLSPLIFRSLLPRTDVIPLYNYLPPEDDRMTCECRAIALIMLVSPLLNACAKNEADVALEPHREAATQTIATLQRLGAAPLPELGDSTAWREVAATPDNLLVTYHEAIPNLTAESDLAGEMPVNVYGTEFGMSGIVQWVQTGEIDEMWFQSERSWATSALRRLAQPAAIVVLETTAIDPGQMVWAGTAGNAVDSYTPGSFQGEAHFFNAAGEPLGGFAFDARNPDRLMFTEIVGQGIEEGQRTLDRNLYDCAWQEYIRQMQTAFPQGGFVVPPICAELR